MLSSGVPLRLIGRLGLAATGPDPTSSGELISHTGTDLQPCEIPDLVEPGPGSTASQKKRVWPSSGDGKRGKRAVEHYGGPQIVPLCELSRGNADQVIW